jgi:hypothetical protein
VSHGNDWGANRWLPCTSWWSDRWPHHKRPVPSRVFELLEADYRRADKLKLLELLRPHLSGCKDAISRPEIGRQLNLTNAAVAMSLHRMRQRYRELLREEVASTVDVPSEIDDEIRNLMTIISQCD